MSKKKLTKAEKEECSFNEFGVWSYTNDQEGREYSPPKFSLKPIPPDYWHDLPRVITPAQWERAETNGRNALSRLWENGHIGYEEYNRRVKKRDAL